MRFLTVVAITGLMVPSAHAQRQTCVLQAIEKKLAESARKDFITNCAAEVQIECDRLADQRKLQSVDRTAFMNNCVTVYVGPRMPELDDKNKNTKGSKR